MFYVGPRFVDSVCTTPLAPGRVSIDVGGREGWDDDAVSERYLLDARRIAAAWATQPGLVTRFVEDPDALHHESAWVKRLPDALRFLLGASH